MTAHPTSASARSSGPCVIAVVVVLAAALLVPVAAKAVSVATPPDPALARDGWRVMTLGDRPAARFADDGDGIIRVEAADGFAMLFREMPPRIDTRVLSWRWRVDTPIPATDLAAKGRDDRPIAVHVWFPDTASERPSGGILTWARRSLGALAGVPVAGKAITYVWGGQRAPGAMIANPHMDDGVIVVLRGADTPAGRWFMESVDIAADYTRAFGQPPPSAHVLAVSADTDDMGGRSLAFIADLMFGGPSARHHAPAVTR